MAADSAADSAADPLGAAPPALVDRMYDRAPGYFTDDDLAVLPEGYGYEIVDGVLIVSPAPSFAHQLVLGELHVCLRAACPDDCVVLMAPFDYKPDPESTWQPDLLVARREDVGPKRLERTPLLVVEIRSGRGLKDRTLKRVAYAEAGVPSYWMVDPDEPSLVVLELDQNGEFAETARLAGDGELAVERPYPVTVHLR